MRAELAGDEMTAILPFSQHLVGNVMIPALHGGVIGAFMEMTALAQLSVSEPLRHQPRTIDVTIEYLRPGRAMATYARADVRKVGKRIANVQVEAWQDARAPRFRRPDERRQPDEADRFSRREGRPAEVSANPAAPGLAGRGSRQAGHLGARPVWRI